MKKSGIDLIENFVLAYSVRINIWSIKQEALWVVAPQPVKRLDLRTGWTGRQFVSRPPDSRVWDQFPSHSSDCGSSRCFIAWSHHCAGRPCKYSKLNMVPFGCFQSTFLLPFKIRTLERWVNTSPVFKTNKDKKVHSRFKRRSDFRTC